MKLSYLTDSVCIVSLPGLRCVTKRDDTWVQNTTYSLELDYKGLSKSFKYVSKDLRDLMYDRICAELTR